MCRQISVAIVVSTAAFTFLTLHIFGITDTGLRIEFETIHKGMWSGHKSQGYYRALIQDFEEWHRIWREH